MSVHGEYGRALEALLICVQRLDTAAAKQWAAGLTQARSSQNPDLSTAARACMRVLDSIDAERSLSSRAQIGPDLDPLREPFAHLYAHCRAVLGISDSATNA
jgi:hypothetical protein